VDTISQRYESANVLESERTLDSKSMIDSIYKSISDMLKLLRKGEEEAQVQMLKWENFVIQHEKMKKLREDISESFKL
jgi:hypothetical protein